MSRSDVDALYLVFAVLNALDTDEPSLLTQTLTSLGLTRKRFNHAIMTLEKGV